MTKRIPFEIREAIVQVCGKAFHYKDPFRQFLIAADVPQELYDRFSDDSKFKIARHVFSQLDSMGEEGYAIQRRILTELCKLRKLPDENAPDREAGLNALRNLKKMALDQKFVAKKEQSASGDRAATARRKQADRAARAEKMTKLRQLFFTLSTSPESPQARGYSLEGLLSELFAALLHGPGANR